MFSNLSAKLALRKMGMSDALNVKMPDMGMGARPDNLTGGNKLRKARPPPRDEADDDVGETKWPAWMSARSLPLTVQPWLAPPPAPVPVAACPLRGDQAPDHPKLASFVGRRPVIVVFLRCVGCAFAQRTFLAARTLANRYARDVAFVAVSHSSAEATRKWMDLLGGAWDVQVVIDEERSVYAAWGLGLGSTWSYLNPGTQLQAWRETGWLGQSVAAYVERKDASDGEDGALTTMGNKWQQAGAFTVNGQGIVMWGHKAARADDLLDLDQAVQSLGIA